MSRIRIRTTSLIAATLIGVTALGAVAPSAAVAGPRAPRAILHAIL